MRSIFNVFVFDPKGITYHYVLSCPDVGCRQMGSQNLGFKTNRKSISSGRKVDTIENCSVFYPVLERPLIKSHILRNLSQYFEYIGMQSLKDCLAKIVKYSYDSCFTFFIGEDNKSPDLSGVFVNLRTNIVDKTFE